MRAFEAEMLDTVHRVETPEGVDLDLRAAGPFPRLMAWMIDFIIRLLIGLVIMIPMMILGAMGAGMWLIILFVLEWFYPVLFEVLRDGSTPGKQMLGLRVVNQNGTPVNWSASIIRNILRFADLLPLFYGFGLIAMLFSNGFRRLGDMAAGTIVVYRDKPIDRRLPITADPRPPTYHLQLEEQRALISFAQRVARIPPSRAEELATIAAPVVSHQASMPTVGETSLVKAVCGVAVWLLGRRPKGPA